VTRVFVFVGPSARPGDFDGLNADVTLLPPVQQGDLLRLADRQPDVIAIVDGYFFQVPSVLHKEIMLALESGTRVLGAASLGALRAAELYPFGMEGVGAIYRMYRRGSIDGDDEVAVLHTNAADGFRALSEPLVSLRHNLRQAVARGLLRPHAAAGAVRTLKQLHFSQRTHAALLDAVRAQCPAAVEPLQAFLAAEAVDLKRQDALALRDVLQRRLRGEQRWPARPRPHVNRTIYVHLFEREYQPQALAVAVHKFVAPSMPRVLRRVRRSLRVRGLVWLQPGIPWDGPLVRELERRGQLAPAVALTREMQRVASEVNEQLPGLAESLADERLEAFAAERWGVDVARLEPALLARGFVSQREFMEAARLAYVYEHFASQPRWTSRIPAAIAISPSRSVGPTVSERNTTPNSRPKTGVRK
jgi:hypothetical protein